MGCCGSGHHHRMNYGHHGLQGRDEHYNMEGHEQDDLAGRHSDSTNLDLLKKRLAKGEITLDEYQQISQVLTS